MPYHELRVAVGLALALGLATAAWASSDAGSKPAPVTGKSSDEQTRAATRTAAPDPLPVYKPPARGKPRARVAGGVRGGEKAPTLQVLVPEHSGQTVSAQPSLFWYLDGPPPESAAVVFTLLDETSIEPLVEAELERPPRAGIYRVDLSDHSVQLERRIEYEWSVALVVDPLQRSKDVVSSGSIDRVEAPTGLGATGRPHSVREYAERGLWYDALAAASDRIRADPADATRRGTRDSLLRQVGLTAR